MRSLDMIASENYVEYTARDIEVMEIVRLEAVAEMTRRIHEENPRLAKRVSKEFWKNNPKTK